MLPTFLRGNMISELIRALLLQIEHTFNRFNTNIPDWLYKAKTNASVQSLEHHIKRELDVDVIITELSGNPIDFLVTVNGFADQGQISKIIDAYGLAGKSYVFEDGEISYTCEFINHVCALTLTDNVVTLSYVDLKYQVSSQFAVKSNLIIHAAFIMEFEPIIFHDFTIQQGQSISDLFYISVQRPITEFGIMTITPEKDNDYIYSYIHQGI